MKKLSVNHTSVLLLLSNGMHIPTLWTYEASNKQVWDDVRDSISKLFKDVYINEMFLACGVQSLRYTRNEVLEIAAKV